MKIGTMELVVILLIAFLVLGPEKTALYTKKLGKGLRTLRIYINSFTDDIKETVTEPLSELQKPLNDLTEPLSELSKPLEETVKAARQPLNELRTTVAVSEAKLNAPISSLTATAKAPAPVPAEEELEEAVPVEEELEEAVQAEPETKDFAFRG